MTRKKLGDERRAELAAAVVAWVRAVFGYEPGVTRIKDVPEGIGEQLMAVGMVEARVATSGPALIWALSGLGDYRFRRGMLNAARVASERSLEVAEGLAKILDAMEARGQYRGYAAFERARRYIDGQLGES